VNGVSCTQNSSALYATAPYTAISYQAIGGVATDNVSMGSGSTGTIADAVNGVGANKVHVNCTDANGNAFATTNMGAQYNGKIYINYTEVETGVTRIATGSYSAAYEA
jgi:hypothetical protein